jgi:hypothetical protein
LILFLAKVVSVVMFGDLGGRILPVLVALVGSAFLVYIIEVFGGPSEEVG